jgi:hypothetical protein
MLAIGWLLLFVTATTNKVQADDVLWVSDLDADPKLIGQEVVVEGTFQQRVGSNRDQILLKNCSVPFQLPADVLKSVPSSLAGGLRIRGTLFKQEGKLAMRVKSLERNSTTDVERYRSAAARLGESDSDGWYRLADRTARLAAVQKNAEPRELSALATEAQRRGVLAEEQSFTLVQWEKLLQLAERAEGLGVGTEETRRMRHKALRWRLNALVAAKPAPADWRKLEVEVTQLLPGAQTPLGLEAVPLVRRYRANPLDVYQADLDARDVCDRELFVEVASRALLAAAEQPKSDLIQLSDDAKRRLPDRPELWLELLGRWADAEAAEVASQPPAKLSAIRVRKLADTFRKTLNKPGRADDVLRKWLDSRRERIGRSADGRVQLARDYRTDLGDIATAVRLLQEALEIEPELLAAIDELKSLGFVKGHTGWIRGDDKSAVGAVPQAPPRGRMPEPGMSPDQVRSLPGLGKPDEILRFATAGRVIEQWSYRGPPDIHVTFIVSPNGKKVLTINTPNRK